MDEDGHGPFRDLCLVYGDFYRPVFLEAIQDWFIWSANSEELKALRENLRASHEPSESRGEERASPWAG